MERNRLRFILAISLLSAIMLLSVIAVVLANGQIETRIPTSEPYRQTHLEPAVHLPGLPVSPPQSGMPLPSPTPVISDEGVHDNLHNGPGR